MKLKILLAAIALVLSGLYGGCAIIASQAQDYFLMFAFLVAWIGSLFCMGFSLHKHLEFDDG